MDPPGSSRHHEVHLRAQRVIHVDADVDELDHPFRDIGDGGGRDHGIEPSRHVLGRDRHVDEVPVLPARQPLELAAALERLPPAAVGGHEIHALREELDHRPAAHVVDQRGPSVQDVGVLVVEGELERVAEQVLLVDADRELLGRSGAHGSEQAGRDRRVEARIGVLDQDDHVAVDRRGRRQPLEVAAAPLRYARPRAAGGRRRRIRSRDSPGTPARGGLPPAPR